MKIVTWNVNSVRRRADAIGLWLDQNQPDVVCLQETKVCDEDFPVGLFRECGYRIEFHGQKAYNGVAIASLDSLEEVAHNLSEMDEQGQARLICGTVRGVRIICAYVPNGSGEKYPYKLNWLGHFANFLVEEASKHQKVVACGDYNVAPSSDDVYDIEHYGRGSPGVRPEERAAYQQLLTGYSDAHFVTGGGANSYTWWDYRAGSLQRNQGLRIDHFLLAGVEPLKLSVDKLERQKEGASDHAPVVCEIKV